MTIIEGLYTRNHDFQGFWSICQRVFDTSPEIFFGSKILPSSCGKHQNFYYGCPSYPGNEAQSPDFSSSLFRHKPLA